MADAEKIYINIRVIVSEKGGFVIEFVEGAQIMAAKLFVNAEIAMRNIGLPNRMYWHEVQIIVP